MALRSRSAARSIAGVGLAGGALVLAFLVGVHRQYGRPFGETEQSSPAAAEPAGAFVPIEEPLPPPPGWDISNIDHPRVDYWIESFQTDKRERFEGFLRRKGVFEPMISAALAERAMPQDLIYLAMVESGFETRAYSRAHASGLWQFIRSTAGRYGLEINQAVDERNDPVKATAAALHYLEDLHRRFGSWYLAAAAYNTGERRVERVMRATTGRVRGTDVDYYRIWSRLPDETRDYVPLMIAAARISKAPEQYGFDVGALEPWAFQQVLAGPSTPLVSLAKQAGTTVAAIRALNPHLKLDRTRNDRAMLVRVPVGPEGALPGVPGTGTLVAD